MNCQQAQKLMLQFVENELQPGETAALEAHLATCEACQHDLADLQVFTTGFARRYRDDLDRLNAPPQAWDALQERLAHRESAPISANHRPRTVVQPVILPQAPLGKQPMIKRTFALNMLAFGLVALLVIAVIAVVVMPRQNSSNVGAVQATDEPSPTTDEPLIITVMATAQVGTPVIITATPPPTEVVNPLETIFDMPDFDQFMAISPDGESMVISNWELGGPKTWYLVRSDGSEPVVLASDQPYYRYIDWSPDGRRLLLQLLTDEATNTYNIFMYDIDTQALTQLTDRPLQEYPPSYRDSSPMWSPDGSRILYVEEQDREPTVFVMNADGSGRTQLTDDLPIHHMPLWSPDGSQIAFTVFGTPTGTLLRADLYVMNADGSGLKKLAEQIGGIGLSWSSDSSQLVYSQVDPGGATEQNPHGNFNLYIVDVASGESRQLTANEADDEYPVWSPDGQYIAFGSNREGEFNLWLIRPDGTDLRRLENQRALYPYWSPDSQSLVIDRLVPFVEYTYPARNREENSILRAYLSDFVPSDSTP